MDQFVDFSFVLLDASGSSKPAKIVERTSKRERIDLIARQFHDFLTEGDQSDTTPHGLVLTYDFKLCRQIGKTAGWMKFMVDRGSGKNEELEEVALVVFTREYDDEGQNALQRLQPYINPSTLPSAPVVVAVRLSSKVPRIIEEWYGKAAAGFFGREAGG